MCVFTGTGESIRAPVWASSVISAHVSLRKGFSQRAALWRQLPAPQLPMLQPLAPHQMIVTARNNEDVDW